MRLRTGWYACGFCGFCASLCCAPCVVYSKGGCFSGFVLLWEHGGICGGGGEASELGMMGIGCETER